MRLSTTIGFDPRRPRRVIEQAQLAESLGYWAVWTGEAYGADAVVPLAAVATHTKRIRLGTSIMQMAARTPAMTAMTAGTLDALSDGRFLLGLGLSGPQVVEGWHGRPYTPPLVTTREYVAAVRAILARERFEMHGETIDAPYRGPGATGAGRALKLMLRTRAEIPIYLAAIGPENTRLATQLADGFLPLFWSPTRWSTVFGGALDHVDPEKFDVAPAVQVVLGDDVDACRDAVRPFLTMYVGGMGARGRNFYNAFVSRLGYEEIARRVQDLFLDGKRDEAAAALPVELIDEVALCGPRARIADRFDAWKESPITTLNVSGGPEALALMAELAL